MAGLEEEVAHLLSRIGTEEELQSHCTLHAAVAPPYKMKINGCEKTSPVHGEGARSRHAQECTGERWRWTVAKGS